MAGLIHIIEERETEREEKEDVIQLPNTYKIGKDIY